MADEVQKPLYMILSNKALDGVVSEKPLSLQQLAEVPGFGPVKVKSFGAGIVEIVQKYCKQAELPITPNSPSTATSPMSDSDFLEMLKQDKRAAALKKKAKADSGVSTSTEPKKKRRSPIDMMSPEEMANLDSDGQISVRELNKEQLAAATHALKGNNVFITGSAGTGKTFLMKYAIQELRKKHGDAAVAVTAPTGIAAITVGGQTIHSFAGIGLGTLL